jgi:hypothetical protein
MSDKPNKTYVDGVFIKSRPVGDSVVLKVSIKAEDLCKFLEQHKNEGGWVNLDIWERKTPSDKGYTHTVSLDDWKPASKGGEQSAKPATKPAGKPAAKKADPKPADDGDEIPF